MLHTHLLPGDGTTGPLVIVVPSEPSLTPLNKKKNKLKSSGKCKGKFVHRHEDVLGGGIDTLNRMTWEL
jgi:hypothetical protein